MILSDMIWSFLIIQLSTKIQHRSTTKANHQTTTISPSYQMNPNDIMSPQEVKQQKPALPCLLWLIPFYISMIF
jgi:hypothetical protein